jgi:hypothetical protein
MLIEVTDTWFHPRLINQDLGAGTPARVFLKVGHTDGLSSLALGKA